MKIFVQAETQSGIDIKYLPCPYFSRIIMEEEICNECGDHVDDCYCGNHILLCHYDRAVREFKPKLSTIIISRCL